MISYKKIVPALIVCAIASLISGCSNTHAEKKGSISKENYPLQMALHLMGASFQDDVSDLSVTQHVNRVESPDKAVVTIEASGLLDDSVSAEKTVFTMNYENDAWHIVSRVKTQRCWPGRGHTGFSAQPCH